MSVPRDLVNLITLLSQNTLPTWLWRRRLQQAQLGFADIVMLARADTTVVECNETRRKVLGDWRGRRWLEALPVEEQEEVRQKIAQLTPQHPFFSQVSRLIDGRGEVRWFEWVNQGIFDWRGRLQFIRGLGRDITEKKQWEENLRLREAQLRAVLDALPLSVWARDPQGVLTLQNATDRAWFGDLLGTSLEAVAQEHGDWQEYVARALRGEVVKYEGKELVQGEERYTYATRASRAAGALSRLHQQQP